MLGWRWVLNATPQPLLPQEREMIPTAYKVGWGPDGQCGWVQKIVAPTNIQSPDHPASSESLYQLGYSHPQLEVICAKTDYRQIFFTLINHKKILLHSSVPIFLQHSDS